MTRIALFALALGTPAWAQDTLATYHADNCCLPPEYAYEVNVTILQDGNLTLTRCEGYATEGPDCQTRRAQVPADALQAIRAAALASGLAERPASDAPAEEIPIGGGSVSGSVVLDGATIPLPAFPVARDADRVRPVLEAIRAAIPARLSRFLRD
jgi:hypothetical protein